MNRIVQDDCAKSQKSNKIKQIIMKKMVRTIL